MGKENSKCCCSSKENNEFQFEERQSPKSIESDNNSNKLKNPNIIKDLKSYVSFKNIESLSQKEDESSSIYNNNNNNIDKDSENNKETNKKSLKIVSFKSEEEKREKDSENDDDDILNKAIKKFEKENKNNSLIEKKKEKPDKIVQSFFGQRSLSTLPDTKNGKKAYNTYSIIKIQKIYKGHYYRKKIYPSKKKELEEQLYSKLKELYDKYLTDNLKNQENSIGINHNEESYKTLLCNSNSFGISSAFMKGFRLFTKLYILKYNEIDAFYVGEVDMNNNLNGKGILTLSDGTRYNGTFEKNNFNGIGKIIDNEGTLFEGYFKEGKLDGKATQKMLNGSIYIGDFIKGIK